MNLSWKKVDLEKGEIEFFQQKGKKTVKVPLHRELAKVLSVHRIDEDDRSHVFPTLQGKASSGSNGLSGMFRRLMDQAGIDARITPKDGSGRAQSALSFHSLRHSFNSHLADLDVAQERRQKMTGHASKVVNDDYTHPEMETLKKAVNQLPKVEGSGVGETPSGSKGKTKTKKAARKKSSTPPGKKK